MKKISIIFLVAILLLSVKLFSQSNKIDNASSKLLSSGNNLTVGGYGQIDYNKPFGSNEIANGNLDVHRLVILFGYRFNEKLSFISEIEIEHVKEVYVEQAFLVYNINTYVQIRGGLMLVPMGIINEYHEPTTFNGVERPLIDKYISPTTWREIGIGVTGTIPEISIKYQAYLMNGFSSYNGSAQLSGQYGLRNGRQKGAKSIIKTPVFAGRVEYFGILGLNFGLSAYYGNTQSTEYNKLDTDDVSKVSTADSSVVKVGMLGFDMRYQKSGFQLRLQTYYTNLSNTLQYNYFTATNNIPNDLGSSMYGYYLEVGYNVFHLSNKISSELIPFVRYSAFDTQSKVAEGLLKNDAYKTQVITAGISWKPITEVALKADVQLIKSHNQSSYNNTFNAGVAIWF